MKQRVAFVLAATHHGPLILNRLDYCATASGAEFGVGIDILRSGGYGEQDVHLLAHLLQGRRENFGDGVVALDCGANIGVLTVDLAKRMADWGQVIAIEAQERIFYALAGNIALNNCFNARAILAAVGSTPGSINVPVPDYLTPGSFGSVELKPSGAPEYIGQAIDYTPAAMASVDSMIIDAMGLTRLDLLKIDVEGMELEVLAGARLTLAACRPIVFAEHIKVGHDRISAVLEAAGYKMFISGMNSLAIHQDDPVLALVKQA